MIQATVFDALLASLHKAADFNRDDCVAPAAVLWPDEKREWEKLVPRLRMALPQFLTLGAYDAAQRTGPAIWLRCVLAGKVTPPAYAGGSPGCVPIIYLPSISRATLRATEECPPELKPLAELQYRGVFWSQQNSKDWTIAAFLQTNHGGLQLKIAKDQAAAAAIRRAVEKLVDVPIAELQARSASGELNSDYFHLLISDDPVDDLLTWLSDPDGVRKRRENDRWETMCGYSQKNYGFDPLRDGPLVGAELLGLQAKPAWKTAWKRFATAPGRYAGLIEQLRRAKPKTKGMSLFENQQSESWPQDNEAAEAELRQALLQIAEPRMEHGLNTDKEKSGKSVSESTSDPGSIRVPSVANARLQLLELEQTHKDRREWVWAKLNLTPLANALQHLAKLAEVTRSPLAGGTTADMVKAYTEHGWQADAAVLDTLASVTHPQDRAAVCEAIAHVYTPWLRDAAELFQERVKQSPLPGRELPRLADVPGGTCVFFADGLRYDVGQKLKAALEVKLGPIHAQHQFVAVPSVTPTAKPAVSPVAGKIKGTTAGEEFRPCVAVGQAFQPDAGQSPISQPGKAISQPGKADLLLTIDRFRKLLEDDGYQILGAGETGDPNGRAWTEFGNLDKTGHDEGIGLARRIPELIVSLVHRVESLLAAGWREVRIVTDHGWLLLPKGLPKSEMPKYLTATRWGRCAVVNPSATVQVPCFSWFWADDVRIACPPGIGSFIAGKEYSHGGLSLQECVVPQFSIQAGEQPAASASIESHKWAGLRCRIKVGGQFDGCKMDLRDKPADPTTSLVEAAKTVGKDGAVSLVVKAEYDAREGEASTLVLLDPAGNVVEKVPTTVGG